MSGGNRIGSIEIAPGVQVDLAREELGAVVGRLKETGIDPDAVAAAALDLALDRLVAGGGSFSAARILSDLADGLRRRPADDSVEVDARRPAGSRH